MTIELHDKPEAAVRTLPVSAGAASRPTTKKAILSEQSPSFNATTTAANRCRGALGLLAVATLLTACGGGAVFIGDGFGASVNVPPPNGNGDEVLSVVTQEPAGNNCIRGGSRVDSGIDYNRNGVLEAGEVQTIRYVCDGAARVAKTGVASSPGGAEMLVSLTAEPAGANCAGGGQKIDAGTDSDADGALAAGEVAASNFLCSR